ncbi:MAG: dihydroxy-acid dehydratase [OCS116 cluster bacterium]|nr:dihydroxy-acid dehydratase [OCS116 cluster bacterium]
MNDERNNRADIDKYGILSWVYGCIIAAVLLAIMFFMAAPIS